MNVTVGGKTRLCRTVDFNAARNTVQLIEQRLLPHQFKIIETRDYEATADAIRDMIVRGAGAIGATAAYGLAQGAQEYRGRSLSAFRKHLDRVYRTLADARPTAVDPVNAMHVVREAALQGATVAEQQLHAVLAAEGFAESNLEDCSTIGDYGEPLIRDGMNILTHCNAGWLAFVDIGTATAPLYAAHAMGKRFHVYCDETRPRCQGAALTAWELAQQGISHQVIADNAAGLLFSRDEIDMVIVGSDRVLGQTGEVANKIGTYTKAVLARRHRVPFYVAIPLSTIDWTLASGAQIPIEERDEREVLGAWGMTDRKKREYVRIANPSSRAFNPGFDITPPELITGIITPMGIFPPRQLWKHRAKLMG